MILTKIKHKQINIIKEVLNYLNNEMKMVKLKKKWENNNSAYETLIEAKKLGKKELIRQIFIE